MKPLNRKLPGWKHGNAHYHLLTAILAALLSLAAFAAHAQEPLTDAKIRALITTIEKSQDMASEFEELNELASEREVDMSRLFSSSVEQMEGREEYGILEDMVQNHGFSNLKEWAKTGDRVFAAWMAIEMGSESAGLAAEMQEALAEIDNNPDMSEQQKAQMRAMMAPAMSMSDAASNVPQQDMEAVRPHIGALKSASDAE